MCIISYSAMDERNISTELTFNVQSSIPSLSIHPVPVTHKSSFFSYTQGHLNHNPNTQLHVQKRGLPTDLFYNNTSQLLFYLNTITALSDVNSSDFPYYVIQFVPYFCESWQFGGIFFHTCITLHTNIKNNNCASVVGLSTRLGVYVAVTAVPYFFFFF